MRGYVWLDEVIQLLGQVPSLSLDHDLGDDGRSTGYDVFLWIEEAVAMLGFVLPRITIHSGNASVVEKVTTGWHHRTAGENVGRV